MKATKKNTPVEKEEPKALAHLKATNKAKFTEMYNKEYKTSYTEDQL